MDDSVKLTPEEEKARKRRSMLIALTIGAFVVLVFFISMAKIQQGGISP